MENKQLTKFFLIISLFLAPNVFAQEVQTTEIPLPTNEQVITIDNSTANQEQTATEQTVPENTTKNSQNKEETPEQKPVMNFEFKTKLDSPAFENSLPHQLRPFVALCKRHNINMTTLIAITGLLGTFFGLFSTWTIYLLNKKNNDPFVIDKKDAGIKYLEAIEDIKEQLNQVQCNNFEEFKFKINEIPIQEVHNRYKKHIKPKHAELFNSFISLYSETKNENNYDNIQNKLDILQEKIKFIKKRILKDLKK